MMRPLFLSSLLMAACGEPDSSIPPDAGPQADAFVATPAGDFDCVGVPWQTTAPDPLQVGGTIIDYSSGAPLAAVPVEIRDADSDAVLAQLTTGSTVSTRGAYNVDLATGGTALRIYRTFVATDHLDTYVYDPMAQFTEFQFRNPVLAPDLAGAFYQNVGRTYDPAKGIVAVQVSDCLLPGLAGTHPVEGASVDAPPGARVLYVPADGIFTSATAGLVKTTSAGVALVLGVEPGLVDITVHAGPITYRPWPITVRADSFTWSPRHP